MIAAFAVMFCNSCTDPLQPDDNQKSIEDVEWGKTSIGDVLKGSVGETFEMKAVVVGANEQGAVLSQNGDEYIYAFKGEAHGLVIGDLVNVSGTLAMRNGLIQFDSGCEMDKIEHYSIKMPKAEEYSVGKIEAYMDAPSIKYVFYTGTVSRSGVYTNFKIEGTEIIGSFDYMTEDFVKKYNNHKLTVKGWLFGSYKNYLYTLPVEVEDKGLVETEVPEGAIYFSNFDKEEYGKIDGAYPDLADVDGWINHFGSGVGNVTYSYQKMSVRNNQSSKGSLSFYDGSGANNIFFGAVPNYFIIEKIAVPQTNLKLTFGAQRYAQGASNDFLKSDFQVRVSADGQTWSQKLDYDFGDVEDVGGQWRLATANFTLPAGTGTLYIKYEAKYPSVSRLDDVLLVAGEGGQVIEFGKEEVVNTSTIAEIVASPIDEIYKAEGKVIAVSTKSFLLSDATGSILVFKSNHGVVSGDKVTVEGATSEYGGLKQFGATSVITKTGEEAVNLPEPKAIDAAYCDAFVNAPKIEYVSFVGNLSSYRDEIYQTHYNVAIEGTDVVIAIQYPTMSLDKFLNNEVKVQAYTIGASGSTARYLNVMATSVDFAEAEEIPAEDQAISVKELNARLKEMNSGAALADLVAVVGYVAANNEGGALYQAISLVDNTGEASSGIIIKGDDYTEKTLPVGTKVIVSLKRASYDLFRGLPQIKQATVYPTAEKAEIFVPEIEATQCADYLGQYVRVKNLTPESTATTWVVNNKTTTTRFTGKDGAVVASYVTKYAVYKDEMIAQRTADLLGVMEVYDSLYELIPTSMSDVAGFKLEE